MNIDLHGTNFILLLIPFAFIVIGFLFKKSPRVRFFFVAVGIFFLVSGTFFKMHTPVKSMRYELDSHSFDAAQQPTERVIIEEKSFDQKMREKELQLESEGEARMDQFLEDTK